MHPNLEAVGNLSNLRERIDRARVHGPGIRDDAEWNITRLNVGGDFCNEIVHPDLEVLVDRDVAHTFPSDSQERRRFRDGKMRFARRVEDRKSTRLNSSHQIISYAVFCLKQKNDYSAS